MEKFLWRLDLGWGKVVCCMEHKSGNISETRGVREKVTMEGLLEFTNALSNGTIPNPYGLLFFPSLGVRNPTQN